jgi:2,3-bisphosphoglycerate-independent phosphoglycerate mutase
MKTTEQAERAGCAQGMARAERRASEERKTRTECKRPVVLAILDGWGRNDSEEANAICAACTPYIDGLFKKFPHALLQTSGESVGLPAGQMGSSEVGHLNIGAGRIVYQEMVRISKSIREGTVRENPVIAEAFSRCAGTGKALHLMGLVSPGGVHSHTDHLYGFLRLAKEMGVDQILVHAFLDGRDVPPRSAIPYLQELEQVMAGLGVGRIATVMGRYYAMDRDKRWERVEKAYRAMTLGEGIEAASAVAAVKQSYAAGVNDEFVVPSVVRSGGRTPDTVKPGDSVFFFNFRPDRAREITRAFVDRDFSGFERPAPAPMGVHYVCLTQYDETIAAPVAYPPEGKMKNILSEVLGNAGLRQLRIAETEKYAHVTFFFNGGDETPFPHEERILIPSPKVATYDLEPAMSSVAVTERLLQEIASERYDVIIINYANLDMVGHTGVFDAAVKAAEAVDKGISEIVPAILAKGGAVLITADHGNAEQMTDYISGEPMTAHTTNPVPVILAGGPAGARLRDGILADVAPTLLELLRLPQPVEMTGQSLIVEE